MQELIKRATRCCASVQVSEREFYVSGAGLSTTLAQVALVNFSVTRDGLEAQLLGDVMLLENPDAELQKTKMQIQNTTDQRQLQELVILEP